jgi:hypothetical protein
MGRVLLSETKDWKLEDKDQDLRGWEVRDAKGQPIGTVGDMIVDTDAQRVDTLVLEDGSTFRAADAHLADGVVYVDSYGAPAHARPYGEGHSVRRAEDAGSAAAAPAAGAAAGAAAGTAAPATTDRAYTDHEDAFRHHYRDAYGDLDYADYAPAYRFGYDMAYDDRYSGRDFDAAEPELREAYYRRHGYPMSDKLVWNSIRDAVRHAYDRVRAPR